MASPSPLPVITRWPSGENATDQTGPLCPLKLAKDRPVATSQRVALPSSLPVSSHRSSGETPTDQTASGALKVTLSQVLDASQILAVKSPLPEMTCKPSGANATDRTSRLCPLSVSSSRPVAACHTLAV